MRVARAEALVEAGPSNLASPMVPEIHGQVGPDHDADGGEAPRSWRGRSSRERRQRTSPPWVGRAAARRASSEWYDSGWSANDRKKSAHDHATGCGGSRVPGRSLGRGSSVSVPNGRRGRCRERARVERGGRGASTGSGVGSGAGIAVRGREHARCGCRGPRRRSGPAVTRRGLRARRAHPVGAGRRCWRRGWSSRRPSSATRSGRRDRDANRVRVGDWHLAHLRAPCSSSAVTSLPVASAHLGFGTVADGT